MAAKKAVAAVGHMGIHAFDHVKKAVVFVHKQVSVEAALADILVANQEPEPSRAIPFKHVVDLVVERAYVQAQFQTCQAHVGMHPHLLFFNGGSDRRFVKLIRVWLEPYESQYLAFLNSVNRFRVRLCFSLGAAAMCLCFWYEAARVGAYDPSDVITPSQSLALYGLTFGVIVPTFALGALASFVPAAHNHLERVATVVYAVVALALITKKCVQQVPGAIFPLVILLIPLFNVTRMRFAVTCVVGWSIVGIFFVVQLAAGPDPEARVVFTTLNYAVSVIAGMVSSYQKELLKRRNFTLGLNFSGAPDDASSRIHSPYYKKEALCHPWTQAFKHPDLERRFLRFWYLLDANPYENVNAGILHTRVALGLRYTLAGLVMNQLVLVLQDVMNLYGTDTELVAFVIRFGGIVPAYVCLVVAMTKLSRGYTAKWLASRRASLSSSAARHVVVRAKASSATVRPRVTPTDQLEDMVEFAGVARGYTHAVQLLTALAILLHVCLIGTLFDVIADKWGIKDVYFMGFLNAMMVAHRSSFRLRFVYSAPITTAASIGFLLGTRNVVSPRTLCEYMVYLTIVQVLGMVMSFEEENLRRSFFLKKSLRALEFHVWYARVTQLPPWIRRVVRERARAARRRLLLASPIPSSVDGSHKPVVTNASARYSHATKCGVYATAVSVVIALGQVVVFLTHNPTPSP
ncbi:Aste57867_15791 [Aphanomyces stellatus]|uniref:Aste57867_15791 protein n=1 Tax=Aphanomyces stellatus TaxID=120398 RepID=A0A485L4X4_9STRA|nr:hypothetical protein As57867_015735 [Aphanomyces stellatus]VFT92579.1 Aste57867_15791 [Aphanomyces stellatus]